MDGNDILPCAASKEAVEVARSGGGPTLIEAYTYRLGDHTTSDDARRYRLTAEAKKWEARDPLVRTMKLLYARGVLDDKGTETIWEEARQAVEDAVSAAESAPPPSLEDVFQYTFEDLPPSLAEQLDALRGERQ